MSTDIFLCPSCGHEHSISDMELWEVYEEDGKETEYECSMCQKEFIITSEVIGWNFETELIED